MLAFCRVSVCLCVTTENRYTFQMAVIASDDIMLLACFNTLPHAHNISIDWYKYIQAKSLFSILYELFIDTFAPKKSSHPFHSNVRAHTHHLLWVDILHSFSFPFPFIFHLFIFIFLDRIENEVTFIVLKQISSFFPIHSLY